LRNALQTAESCDCEDGCVKCVKSLRCKENNLVSSKFAALIILKSILDIKIEWDAIDALAVDDGRGGDFREDTIVEAPGVGTIEGIVIEKDVS
jgi:DEAD/DEAH box helicase domain-containing protein